LAQPGRTWTVQLYPGNSSGREWLSTVDLLIKVS
jgi:hypothetical protein